MNKYHDKTFPNESSEYREARNRLLEAEINLRRQTEEVADLRRNLPLGGVLKEDYVFDELDLEGKIKKTKLSELFSGEKNTLIIYSFMYGPNEKSPCVMCNSIIDGLNGMIFHANQRTNFVMTAKAPINKINDWGKSRDWKNVRILSSFNNTYNTDYFGEDEKGFQLPMLNVFQKTAKGITHFYGTELLYTSAIEGQNSRHVDSIWPLWNLFDLIPEGRGTDWYPRHN
ncbi:MAG TPA: DUF899 family protein, partial [Ignavibacteria bacterium]|nr:DUF899 family protein [Ignavibacteria bacterium]